MKAVASLALGFLMLALVFGPLERLFPARRQRLLRPELAIDACFFAGQYLAFAALVTSALAAMHGTIGPVPALTPLRGLMAQLPFWAQAIIAIVIGDLVVYWFHRASHRFDLLWRFHGVHHSVEHLDWLAAHREHPVDGLFTQVLINLPGFVLGLRFDLLGPLVVFRGMWAIFIHSNVRLPLGPLRLLFGAPELHRWHHAKVERTAHNFANLAPYLDRLFGTYHCPAPVDDRYPLGRTDPWPRGYVAQLLWPLGIRRAAWLRGGPSLDRDSEACKPEPR